MSHPSRRCGRERLLRTIQIGVRSIESLRSWFVENRLEACLTRKKQERPSIPRMFDGEKKTMLIAVACSPAPKDRARWTRNLLDDPTGVEKKRVEAVVHTVGARRRIRLRDVERAGGLHSALRFVATGGLSGSEEQADGGRNL